MIDMGFEEQLQQILKAMPSTNMAPVDEAAVDANKIYRQTVMFSATMPPKVESIAKELRWFDCAFCCTICSSCSILPKQSDSCRYLRRPVIVRIGEVGKAVDRIEQRVKWCRESEK